MVNLTEPPPAAGTDTTGLRVPDLVSLHDALGCATAAAVQAWRGDRDSASLSLLEAQVAAEEAFGPGSAGVDALNVVFAAIKQAADRDVPAPRPASDPAPASTREESL